MIMTKKEILEAINTVRVAYMATVDGDKPHVRAMGMVKADETGIYFQAWTLKDVHKEILKNPNVELCYNTKDGKQIRVSGKFEILNDLALKKEIEAARPFTTPIMKEKGGYDIMAVYRMQHGKAMVWTMAENFVPKTYVEL